MDKIKFALLYIVKTHIGRFLLLLVILITSGIIQNGADGALLTVSHYTYLVSAGLTLVYVLVMMVYAWIINPIREMKETDAERKKYK